MKPKRVNEKKAIKVFVNTDFWFCTFVENKVYILKLVLWLVFFPSISITFLELIISNSETDMSVIQKHCSQFCYTHKPENAITNVIDILKE